MTTIVFKYMAKELPDKTHRVNLYLKQIDNIGEDSPLEQRKSIKDAAQIVHDLVKENEAAHPNDRLLMAGDPPEDTFPVFMFAIEINWNRAMRNAHYSRVCYQRYNMDGKWNPIAALGMEQMDYTMRILRNREKAEIKKIYQKG